MQRHGLKRIGVVVAVCALVGALAGIAGSAAAPSKSSSAVKKKSSTAAKRQARAERRALRIGPRRRLGPRFHGPGGPALHSEAVVPNEDGTGFGTITTDAGTLLSVDGATVHLKQATAKATYKADAAIDVGSDAKVVRNGDDAKLSDLEEGDRVHIIKAPKGTFVMAASEDWIKSHRPERGFHRHGHGPGAPPPPPRAGGPNQNGSSVEPAPFGSDGSKS